MAFSILLYSHFAMCLLSMAVVSSTSPFLPNTPGQEWKMVGYLDMTDPTQQCPDSWLKFTSPRSSCGKKSGARCDSLKITTSGASYQTVCGRFRGYQYRTPDGFYPAGTIETHYVDGVSVTYGTPGSRHHVYTYTVGHEETSSGVSCPCAGGNAPPNFVGSDYHCESGNPGPGDVSLLMYSSDVLWDRQQCGGNESTCCNSPYLPWFCKNFTTPISGDLEVRICTDESLENENVAIESFELYIQVASSLVNIQAVSVLNSDNTLHQIEIFWIPVGSNVTLYTVRIVGADSSVGQGFVVCTTSPCLYVYQVTHGAVKYNISLTSLNQDGTLGSKTSTTISPTNSVIKSVSYLSYSNLIGCSFLSNQSYCVVCCSTDPSVPPDSSLYNISTTRGTDVIVSLQGLTSGQMYYCKAAASNISSTRCVGPVVGDIKVYLSFVASLPALPTPNASYVASIDTSTIIGITIAIAFVVFFSMGVLVATSIGCLVKKKPEVSPHPAMEPSVYEMIETDQKIITAIEVEANSAYGVAK